MNEILTNIDKLTNLKPEMEIEAESTEYRRGIDSGEIDGWTSKLLEVIAN